MILVAVSKVGRTILIFVEPGAKINGQYCRDLLLMQELIPTIRSIAGDMFVFKPAHQHSRSSASRTHKFISHDMWPANSHDLDLVDYCIWGMMQERVY